MTMGKAKIFWFCFSSKKTQKALTIKENIDTDFIKI